MRTRLQRSEIKAEIFIGYILPDSFCRAAPVTHTQMVHRDVEAATPLLGGDDTRPRSRGSSRPVVIALGSLAFAALIGLGVYTHNAGPLPGLDLLKNKEKVTPKMYALMGESQGLPQQLKSLQCYAKMARETGSELVVGPVKTRAVSGGEDEYVSFDAIVKPEPGTWRAMTKDDRAAFLTHNLDRGCITALRDQDTIGTTFVSPGDETVRSDPFTSAADRVSHSRLAAAAAWRGASHRVPIVPNAPSSHDLGVHGPYRAVLVGPAASREPRRSPTGGRPAFAGGTLAHPGYFWNVSPRSIRRVI